jgi:hypothetical protein
LALDTNRFSVCDIQTSSPMLSQEKDTLDSGRQSVISFGGGGGIGFEKLKL